MLLNSGRGLAISKKDRRVLIHSTDQSSDIRIIAAMDDNLAFPQKISSADLLKKDRNNLNLLFLVALHTPERLPDLLTLLDNDDERYKALRSTCWATIEAMN